MHNAQKQHSGKFIREIGGWGKYYRFLKDQKTIRRESVKIGRNELVTIKKGDAVKVLKFKKAINFINNGWEIK
jgi:hypothetical protein